MDRQAVQSSDILSIGYDPETCLLEVEFKRASRLYIYKEVPPEVCRDLVGAPSVGKYFAANIKGKYAFTTHEEVKS